MSEFQVSVSHQRFEPVEHLSIGANQIEFLGSMSKVGSLSVPRQQVVSVVNRLEHCGVERTRSNSGFW